MKLRLIIARRDKETSSAYLGVDIVYSLNGCLNVASVDQVPNFEPLLDQLKFCASVDVRFDSQCLSGLWITLGDQVVHH